MASYDEVLEELNGAIQALTKKAQGASNGTSSGHYANAALALAEARAWLSNPGQPHGGAVNVTKA